MTPKNETQPLLPVTLPKGNIRYAQGMRAGNWVFATGIKGTPDYTSGIPAEVVRPVAYGNTKYRREADQVFRNLGAVLAAGGSTVQNVVRVDQAYTSGRAIEGYHDARRAALKDYIPPSTSTLAAGFLLRDQDMEVHAMAVVPTANFSPRHIRPTDQEVHHTSAYSLALAVGDFVFIAGRIADAPTFGNGLAIKARLPPGHNWKGLPIKLQTEYIVRTKVVAALKAAGSSLENIVKVQVHLRDPEDLGSFGETWAQLFPGSRPAITLMPTATPGFFLDDARIEINLIALRDDGKTRKQTIGGNLPVGIVGEGAQPSVVEGPAAPAGHVHAVRAGDLLFFSGLLAVDAQGLVPEAQVDPAQPYYGNSAAAQVRAMLASAETICAAAGTSLANVVRIQQFHTDLGDFQAAYDVWAAHLPGQFLPLAAVKVPFLQVPGCTVQLDLWVYAPLTPP